MTGHVIHGRPCIKLPSSLRADSIYMLLSACVQHFMGQKGGQLSVLP